LPSKQAIWANYEPRGKEKQRGQAEEHEKKKNILRKGIGGDSKPRKEVEKKTLERRSNGD